MKPNVQANRIYFITYDLDGNDIKYDAIYWDKPKAKQRAKDLSSVANERTSYFKVWEYKIHEDGHFYMSRKVFHSEYQDTEFKVTIDK